MRGNITEHTSAHWYRTLAKEPQGKMIAVSLCIEPDTQPHTLVITGARIDGDFFDALPAEAPQSTQYNGVTDSTHNAEYTTPDVGETLAYFFAHHTVPQSYTALLTMLDELSTLSSASNSSQYCEHPIISSECNITERITELCTLNSSHFETNKVNTNNTACASIIGVSPVTIVLAYLRAINQALTQTSDQQKVQTLFTHNEQSATQLQVDAKAQVTAQAQRYAQTQAESQPQNKPTSQLHSTDYAHAWSTLHPWIIPAQALPSAMHLALDLTLPQAVANGDLPPLLRFWQWSEPTIIIGAHQNIDMEIHTQQAKELGFTLMRRITGGGTMLVRPQQSLTYSLIVPRSWVDNLDTHSMYQLCAWWSLQALQSIGIQANFAPLNDIAAPDGGKIGGAAAKFFTPHTPHRIAHSQGALLYHATLAYDINTLDFREVLRTSAEKLRDKARAGRAVTSADKRVSPLCTQSELSYNDMLEALSHHALSQLDGAKQHLLSELPPAITAANSCICTNSIQQSQMDIPYIKYTRFDSK